MSDGKLYIVGTPIGNLADFSPRGLETLNAADYIAAEDTRVTLKLLTHFGIKKPLISYYKPKEREKSEHIVNLLSEGNTVALVSDAGMPCISDPGYFLIRKCRELGLPVEVVPGGSAATAAIAASGIDSERWTFEGFLPVDGNERAKRLSTVRELPHTLVYYEAPHKLRRTLAELAETLGGEREAALCRELTKLHEEIIRGTLEELAHYYDTEEPRGEFVIVVKGMPPREETYTIEQAVRLAEDLISGGEKPAEACRQAAKATGISKREIYAVLTQEGN